MSSNRSDIPKQIYRYRERFPLEIARTESTVAFVLQTDGVEALFDRQNPIGHITGSAFILDRSRMKLLMIHHRSLDRWLQPGGHVDRGESPLAAAVREAVEETGVAASDLSLLPLITDEQDVPFDIDSHPIPARPARGEGAHVHHDFRFLFQYRGDGSFTHNETEAQGLRWIALNELARHAEFGPIGRKIAEFITE